MSQTIYEFTTFSQASRLVANPLKGFIYFGGLKSKSTILDIEDLGV